LGLGLWDSIEREFDGGLKREARKERIA